MITQQYDSWIATLQNAINTLKCHNDGTIMSDIIDSITEFKSGLSKNIASTYLYIRHDSYKDMLKAYSKLGSFIFHYRLSPAISAYLKNIHIFMSNVLTLLAVK